MMTSSIIQIIQNLNGVCSRSCCQNLVNISWKRITALYQSRMILQWCCQMYFSDQHELNWCLNLSYRPSLVTTVLVDLEFYLFLEIMWSLEWWHYQFLQIGHILFFVSYLSCSPNLLTIALAKRMLWCFTKDLAI